MQGNQSVMFMAVLSGGSLGYPGQVRRAETSKPPARRKCVSGVRCIQPDCEDRRARDAAADDRRLPGRFVCGEEWLWR